MSVIPYRFWRRECWLAMILAVPIAARVKWEPSKPYHDWRVVMTETSVNQKNVRSIIVKPIRNAARDGGTAPTEPRYILFACNAQDVKTCHAMVQGRTYAVLGVKGATYKCDNYALVPISTDDPSVIDDHQDMLGVRLIP